ncbi:MAG TPA: hypothetical protein VMY37_33115 [Thermoguttaceae bacterium]|nr:hypothetical protein [Thermoguttaceae bacterium]
MSDFATIADWASILGLLVSMAGLCITLWVAVRVRRIEQHYVRQALLPSYVRKLGGQIKNLEEGLKSKNRTEALKALVVCQTVLRDLSVHLRGRRAQRVSQVIERIDALRKAQREATFLAQCEEVNADLKASLESLRTLQKELQWRSRDAD